MRVKNMTSNSSGREVPNQFIIDTDDARYFQSYDSVIAKFSKGKTTLDENKWDYSKTTSKYRNQFLGETTKETVAKIKSGEYKLANLNNREV